LTSVLPQPPSLAGNRTASGMLGALARARQQRGSFRHAG
jgi:hypothetical protein